MLAFTLNLMSQLDVMSGTFEFIPNSCNNAAVVEVSDPYHTPTNTMDSFDIGFEQFVSVWYNGDISGVHGCGVSVIMIMFIYGCRKFAV